MALDLRLEKLEEFVDPEESFRTNRKVIVGFSASRNIIPHSRSRIRIELSPAEPKSVEALVSVERAAALWIESEVHHPSAIQAASGGMRCYEPRRRRRPASPPD